MPREQKPTSHVPIALVLGACAAAFCGVLVFAVGDALVAVIVASTAAVEGAVALAIVIAAGGWGYLAIARLAPADFSAALKAALSVALGLVFLATAVLGVGSFSHGLLSAWVWWPVVGAGLVLAAWHVRRGASRWQLPRRVGAASLVWIIVAAVAAVWLAGACRPPGTVGRSTADAYDELAYHLQVPREFYDNARISPLRHNVYSFYPLNQEMLFLLSMCLRCGAYEGMYAAKLTHGLLGVLAVLALWRDLGRDDRPRGLAASLLLATTPGVVFLGFLAQTEIAQTFYLVVALLCLRQWLIARSWRAAACIGLMIGGACATKYLAVGFVAGPVLLAMLLAGIRSRRIAMELAVAGAATLLMWGPWIIRNVATTGNPVFPLATNIFGRCYWSAQEEQRWLDGHGPRKLPPVPEPPGWQPRPDDTSWSGEFASHLFLLPQPLRSGMPTGLAWMSMFGTPAMLLAGAWLAVCLVRRRGRAWDLCLGLVIVVQLLVWGLGTHELPWRFLVPLTAPVSLLAGGAIAGLSRWTPENGDRHGQKTPEPVPIFTVPGIRAAGIIALLVGAGINAMTSFAILKADTEKLPVMMPLSGDDVARTSDPWRAAASLPQGSRLMLVGDSTAFYFPPGTIYAMPFDPQPLAVLAGQKLTGPQMLERLRAMGVTHIWVDWSEIWRLANTYGFDESLSAALFEAQRLGRPPRLEVLDELLRSGMREATITVPLLQQEGKPFEMETFIPRPYWQPHAAGVRWPVFNVYELP